MGELQRLQERNNELTSKSETLRLCNTSLQKEFEAEKGRLTKERNNWIEKYQNFDSETSKTLENERLKNVGQISALEEKLQQLNQWKTETESNSHTREEAVELLRKKVEISKVTENHLETEMLKILEEKDEIESKLRSMEARNEVLTVQNEHLTAKLANFDIDMSNGVKIEQADCLEQPEKLNTSEKELQNTEIFSSEIQSEMNMYKAEIEKLTKENVEIKRQLDSEENQRIELTTRNGALTKKLENYELEMCRIKEDAQTESLQQAEKLNALEKELDKMKQLNSEIQSELNIYKAEFLNHEEIRNNLRKELKVQKLSAEAEIGKLVKELESVEAQRVALAQKIEAFTTELKNSDLAMAKKVNDTQVEIFKLLNKKNSFAMEIFLKKSANTAVELNLEDN